MDDSTKKTVKAQGTGVDPVSANDVLLEQAKLFAQTAAFRKDQSMQIKQDLAGLKAKHSSPSASTPISQVQSPTPTVSPVVQSFQNPGYGGQQSSSAPQPATFPTVPVMEQQ
jgi:hypothetical protein